MSRVRFTAKAREDLIEIWAYIATHNSEAIADRIYDRISRACRLLEDQPRLGPARPELHPEARVLVIERWLTIYRVLDNGIEIARIVDGARDLSALDWPPDSPAAASD